MSNSCKVPFNVPRGTFSFFGLACFHRSCLWPSAGQRFFLFLRLGPRNQPGLSGREGAFCPIPAKHPSMFHVELFSSVMPLARSRPKAFFFSSGSAQETSPACLVGRGPFVQFPAKHHPNVPHGTFFTFQNAKKPGFVRFACFHPPASVL